ncbi:hypothetical protein HAX54_013488, partial [Datura stramonium]|nr:hypothetical protein [Datura stramonium]
CEHNNAQAPCWIVSSEPWVRNYEQKDSIGKQDPSAWGENNLAGEGEKEGDYVFVRWWYCRGLIEKDEIPVVVMERDKRRGRREFNGESPATVVAEFTREDEEATMPSRRGSWVCCAWSVGVMEEKEMREEGATFLLRWFGERG